jgi:hypothetical protein
MPFIAVGWKNAANLALEQGLIWRSADGNIWTEASTDGAAAGRRINDVTVFGDKLIAVGGQVHSNPFAVDGTVWQSSDQGATYQVLAAGLGDDFLAKVIAGGPGLVASMDHGVTDTAGGSYNSFTLWYSSDGQAWQQAAVSSPLDGLFSLNSIARAADGTLVGVANDATATDPWGKPSFLYSSNGMSWQVSQADSLGRVGGVTWDGTQFIVTGAEPCADAADTTCGAIWTSSDGQAWQKTGAADLALMRAKSLGASALLPPLVVAGSQIGQVGIAVWFYGPGPTLVTNEDPDLAVDARPGAIATANGIVVMSAYSQTGGPSGVRTTYAWTTAP